MKTFVLKVGGIKLLIATICVIATGVVSAQDNLVVQTDFEKGTQNWEKRGSGSVSIRSTKKEAASGEKSLKVSGRTENWQGAQLNVTEILSAGKTYFFTVAVKLDKGEGPDEIKMTMQLGDKKWEGVGSANATADKWTTFSGRFKPDGKDPYLLVYVEASRKRTSYFIDDFKIELVEVPKQTGTLLTNDFQDGTAQNWMVRGENVQIFSAAVGEARSLKVGGRTEPWHGLALDLSRMFFKGRTYNLSVSAKLDQGEPSSFIKMTVMETGSEGEENFVQVSSNVLASDTGWVRIAGDYEVKTDGSNFVVIIESKSSKTSFFIDDFEVKIP